MGKCYWQRYIDKYIDTFLENFGKPCLKYVSLQININ